MRENEYCCPICKTELDFYSRYPNYICNSCVEKATDQNGRSLSFSNEGMHGGFIVTYTDNGEKIDSHICYIGEVKCYADEAYMGGIVVEINA